MRTHLRREEILDIKATAETNVSQYNLGPLRGYVEVRIPVRLALWLGKRQEEKRERKETAEDLAVLRLQGKV